MGAGRLCLRDGAEVIAQVAGLDDEAAVGEVEEHAAEDRHSAGGADDARGGGELALERLAVDLEQTVADGGCLGGFDFDLLGRRWLESDDVVGHNGLGGGLGLGHGEGDDLGGGLSGLVGLLESLGGENAIDEDGALGGVGFLDTGLEGGGDEGLAGQGVQGLGGMAGDGVHVRISDSGFCDEPGS